MGYKMNNNSFIMRDQVHNLVPSIMGYERDLSIFKVMRQLSFVVIAIIAFRLFLY